MRLFGITIEQKTDVLAFAAFVISIGGLVAQGVVLLRGAELSLEPLRQVTIFKNTRRDGDYVHLVGAYFYFNAGSPGYSDVVSEERAHLRLGDRLLEFQGQEHGSAGAPTDASDPASLWRRQIEFQPTEVGSGKVVFRETLLVPSGARRVDNSESGFIRWAQFLEALGRFERIQVIQYATSIAGEEYSVTCELVTKEFLWALESKAWSAPVCHPINQDLSFWMKVKNSLQ